MRLPAAPGGRLPLRVGQAEGIAGHDGELRRVGREIGEQSMEGRIEGVGVARLQGGQHVQCSSRGARRRSAMVREALQNMAMRS